MTAYEIAFGVVLIIVSVLICGAVFFVATLLVGVLSARL